MLRKKILFTTTLLGLSTLTLFSSFLLGKSIKQHISKHGLILGTQKISYIPLDHVIPSNETLHYFNQPIPDDTWQDTPSWLGYTATYHINNAGMHNLNDVALKKEENTLRIMTLGDSHTFGQYVSTIKTYPEQLQIYLNNRPCFSYNNVQVLNLGFMGDDVQYSAHRFSEFGQQYQPDIVIWWLKNDDFTMIAELVTPLAEEILQKQNLDPAEYKPRTIMDAYQEAMRQLIETHGYNYLIDYQLTFLKQFLNNYSGEVYFALYQDEDQLFSQSINKLVTSYPQAHLLQIFSKSDLPRLADGHPNAAAYQVVADAIGQTIYQNHCQEK